MDSVWPFFNIMHERVKKNGEGMTCQTVRTTNLFLPNVALKQYTSF